MSRFYGKKPVLTVVEEPDLFDKEEDVLEEEFDEEGVNEEDLDENEDEFDEEFEDTEGE